MGSTPDDLFDVAKTFNGAEIAGPVAQTGCTLTWPT